MSSPEIQVPLKCLGLYLSRTMSSTLSRSPLILGPGLGGVTMTTARATRPMTAPMTRSAMAIPFQLRWLGVAATSSWKLEMKWLELEIVYARKNYLYSYLDKSFKGSSNKDVEM